MKTFTEPLKELKEFETLSAGVHDLRGIAQISGCIDAAKPHIMYSVNNGSGNRIIVTFQEQRAKEIYEEYRFFDPKAAYYPAKDILFYQSDIRGNVLTAERINALKMLAEESSCTIITTSNESNANAGKIYPGSQKGFRRGYIKSGRTHKTSGGTWL